MQSTRNGGPKFASSEKMPGFFQRVPRKLTKFKLIINIFLIAGFLMTVLQFMELGDILQEKATSHFSYEPSTRSAGYDRDQACQFPVLDPFDPSILPYVKHPFPIFCQRVQPELTFMDGNLLKIDSSLARRHRFRDVYYRKIVRRNETHVKLGNWTFWNFTESPELLLFESIEILGFYVFDQRDSKSSPKRYRNLHSSVHVDFEKLKPSKSNSSKLNVLIFGIDSLSRSNFIRNLPKTHSILTDRMRSIVFRGYTKIDDNTFPNILAVLTGRKVTIHGSELDGHFQHDFVDHYPFIWKNFSENRYATGLAEEQPGVLSYKAKGFENSPVDWYFRPFGLALNKSPLRKYSSPGCVGNRPESRILLESIDRFLRQCHDEDAPYFLFTFLWKLSHDKTNDVEAIDHIIADFFRRLFDEGYFNNTVIFVMSDHGNRFDVIRRTLIGRIEERMPYLSVFIPPSFRDAFPSLVENLNENVWRLTCQYDVYETMVDILNQRYGDETTPRFKNRGRSLFTPIPKSRTCHEAHISPHFCVCQKEEDLDVQTSIVRSAADYALEKMNSYISARELSGLCARLKLKHLISAQKYKSSDHVRYGVRWHYNKLLSERNVTSIVSNLRVTFVTSPNDGIYEALIQFYEPSKNHKTDKPINATNVDISRINAYGNHGDCVSRIDRTMEKFCFCRRGFWFFT